MKKYGFPLYATGYIIVIFAVIGLVFNPITSLYAYIPYIFSVGAFISIVGRMLTLPQSDDFRVRRLNNMLALSAILIIGAAYLMFKGENYCILLILISAFIDIYVTFRYPTDKK